MPEHLLTAHYGGDYMHGDDEAEAIRCVLAALTSEDAPLVPVWAAERDALWDQIHRDQHDAMEQAERANAAEAEVQRLREVVKRVEALHARLHRQAVVMGDEADPNDYEEGLLDGLDMCLPDLRRALSAPQDGGDGR